MFRVPVLHLLSHASKIYDASNRGPVDVKWRGLNFSLIFQPVMADRGVYSADCHNENGGIAKP
jgi:hypothetical protein